MNPHEVGPEPEPSCRECGHEARHHWSPGGCHGTDGTSSRSCRCGFATSVARLPYDLLPLTPAEDRPPTPFDPDDPDEAEFLGIDGGVRIAEGERAALAEVLGSMTLTPTTWLATPHMDKIAAAVEAIVATRTAERDEALARLAAVEALRRQWSGQVSRKHCADDLRAALTPSPAPDTDGGDHDA